MSAAAPARRGLVLALTALAVTGAAAVPAPAADDLEVLCPHSVAGAITRLAATFRTANGMGAHLTLGTAGRHFAGVVARLGMTDALAAKTRLFPAGADARDAARAFVALLAGAEGRARLRDVGFETPEAAR